MDLTDLTSVVPNYVYWTYMSQRALQGTCHCKGNNSCREGERENAKTRNREKREGEGRRIRERKKVEREGRVRERR